MICRLTFVDGSTDRTEYHNFCVAQYVSSVREHLLVFAVAWSSSTDEVWSALIDPRVFDSKPNTDKTQDQR